MEFHNQILIQKDLEVLTRFFQEDLEVLTKFYKNYPQYMGFIDLQIKNCLKEKKKYDKSLIDRIKKIQLMDDPPMGELAQIVKLLIENDINKTKKYNKLDIIYESINKEIIQLNDFIDILFNLFKKIIKKDLLNDKTHDFLYERCGKILCKTSNLTEKLDLLSKKGCLVNYKKMDKVKNKCFEFWGRLDDAFQKKFKTLPPNEREFQKNTSGYNFFQD